MSTFVPFEVSQEWDPSVTFCHGSGHGPCPASHAPRNERPSPNPPSSGTANTNPPDAGTVNRAEIPDPTVNTQRPNDLRTNATGILLTEPIVEDDDDAKPKPRPNFQIPSSSPFANFPFHDIPVGSGGEGSPFEFPNLWEERPDTPAEFPPVRAKVVEQHFVEECRDRVRQLFFEFIRHNSLRNLRGRTRRSRAIAGPTKQPWSSTSLLHAVMEEFDAATNRGEHVEMTFI
ncbi:hypothetical protein Pst134EA_028072 [Puccinia striiformis f. sp. tritici]|uniref:Uncharacterized protein n=1 Tax=Puccinia striiformis f. sp. tritici PST-78 TaxID=1165861 RepID=A0A0L0VVF7_9BASI|nr:hypothetical protein Pst134EA_028072 [Puccinia striiformis f. sp. tritici]KAH9448775.1 hypothetical protein Pst134EA_028072 [Puccinia striiformis f. sp. tritici]KAI9615728.1 hypothetical protein KEM48_005501 [Puccinia striiformis f. sp. tritici PST-130]KNF03256.1 hypothetical protein PSTG_03520 [Puccinia striiformis f. sp. tritici PST-78]